MTALPRPHLVQIVADDLGYNDLGYFNGGKTITPTIDGLLQGGVFLSNFYAFRVCAPSRASGLSGRYPWGVGFYDMSYDEHHCIDPRFQLLPAELRRAGYATHAVGKWDVGHVEQHCTPTFRGFDTFLGYYRACTSDYWYHGAGGTGGPLTHDQCGGVDFQDSTVNSIRGAAMSGPASLNNTYDQEVFTRRAVDIITKHDPSAAPLYLYLAYHNVHDSCYADRRSAGLNAPLATVDRYARTRRDTWKVQGAMTTELDYGVANVTSALRARGMWNRTLLMFWSDNGGPLDHSTNWPFRSGKGHEWEGAYRVVAFVAGGLLPPSVAGTNYSGLGHVSDWYVTLLAADGVVGCGLPADTGPRPPDGHNLWPALSGRNLTSPRTEVIHAVTNRYFQRSELCSSGCPSALRVGRWKLVLGVACTDSQIWPAWPAPAEAPVPFGRTGGAVEPGTDHARAPLLSYDGDGGAEAMYADHSETAAAGARVVNSAAVDDDDDDDVAWSSRTSGAPPPDERAGRVCLYDLEDDPSERRNLAGDPSHAPKVAELRTILAARAATGPPVASAYADVGAKNASVDEAICQQERDTGYLEPVDWSRPPGPSHVRDDPAV